MKNKETKEKMELARRVPEFNPFGLMRRFTREMERLFDPFEGFRFPTFERELFPFPTEFKNVEWMPQVEMLKHDGELMVKADLPGLTKDDVKVELTDEALTISGERKEEKEEKHEGFFHSERSYGRFYRQIPLPEGVKTDKAVATFHNGVLEITIPAPKMESHTRKLEIKEVPQKSMTTAA
ncbi:MAG TPA: Hsp20/alpha crystallin family protein [Pyrinomonadaceae bacterium]|nr:Hsp20/alpha crystallin family protein [Pyrinomonadaceae bacterium]